MSLKDERANSIVQHSVGAFLSTLQEPGTLITVTDIKTRDREKSATIFVTIYPESKETETLQRLIRELRNLREYVKTHEKLLNIPFFDYKIDKGEKNRQRIEEISNSLQK